MIPDALPWWALLVVVVVGLPFAAWVLAMGIGIVLALFEGGRVAEDYLAPWRDDDEALPSQWPRIRLSAHVDNRFGQAARRAGYALKLFEEASAGKLVEIEASDLERRLDAKRREVRESLDELERSDLPAWFVVVLRCPLCASGDVVRWSRFDRWQQCLCRRCDHGWQERPRA
jgi:hypothetical protein